MSRLIDVDKAIKELKQFIKDYNLENLAVVLKIIMILQEQPTAFDVNKVMEQLKKQVYEIDDSLSLSARDVIDEEDVFEIVRAGGLDEKM